MDNQADPDYYPRLKINKRWYLIVPELWPGQHTACAFERPGVDDNDYETSHCKLCKDQDSNPPSLDNWDRWDCGDKSSIFVAPKKFPEYLAMRVAERMNQ